MLFALFGLSSAIFFEIKHHYSFYTNGAKISATAARGGQPTDSRCLHQERNESINVTIQKGQAAQAGYQAETIV